jgi:hypothetical protein
MITEERPPGAVRTNFGRRFELAGRPIHAGCFKPPANEAVATRGLAYANG